jgi:aminopeptidase-like protein
MIETSKNIGQRIFSLMQHLWPICRSITGDGVRETLAILKERIPELVLYEVPTGTKCFDWTIPREWSIRDAYIIDPNGNKIVDFKKNNLHIISYSVSVDIDIEFDELQKYLHSLPQQPDAIPYITSYYKETWGFCITQKQRDSLVKGRYHVRIDSELKNGSLTYGEIYFPGETDREVLLSTYVCHPSMANNELSGPCVTIQLAEWLRARNNRFSYRILFLPETIGAICYISQNLEKLKNRTIAGYVITCVGDDKAWSFLPSRKDLTLSDRAARHVLQYIAPTYKEYTFLERGSDERQYCSPGVDLPIASIMRSKYVTYPEYHTSLDNLSFVSAAGLEKAFSVYQKVIDVIEADCTPIYCIPCEPKMSDRGLRPTLGKSDSVNSGRAMMNLLAYADGCKSLLDIAEIVEVPVWELRPIVDLLVKFNLLRLT